MRVVKNIAVAALILGFSGVCFSSESRKEQIVEEVAALIQAEYVLEEKRGWIADRLRDEFSEGKFEASETDSDLAELIGQSLREISSDNHFRLSYNLERYNNVVAALEAEKTESDVSLEQRWGDRKEQYKRLNFGFFETTVLPGTVGIVRLRFFRLLFLKL